MAVEKKGNGNTRCAPGSSGFLVMRRYFMIFFCFVILFLSHLFSNAFSHLYKRVCPPVLLSVTHKLNLFLFRCVLPSLKEGLSVRLYVRPLTLMRNHKKAL